MKRVKDRQEGRLIGVTGTDTGVGKTVVTGLIQAVLQAQGRRVAALKPLCSGGRDDAVRLHLWQEARVPLDVINPHWFAEPVTPSVAARSVGRALSREQVAAHIRGVAQDYDWVVVEGVGGLLAPLGEDWDFCDLLADLRPFPVVVAVNQLGVISQTRLVCDRLRSIGLTRFGIALRERERPDESAATNAFEIERWTRPETLISVPHDPEMGGEIESLKQSEKKLQKTIAQLVAPAIFLASRNT